MPVELVINLNDRGTNVIERHFNFANVGVANDFITQSANKGFFTFPQAGPTTEYFPWNSVYVIQLIEVP